MLAKNHGNVCKESFRRFSIIRTVSRYRFTIKNGATAVAPD